MAIDLQVVEQTPDLPDEQDFAAWLDQVFRATAAKRREVTLRIVGEDESKALNKRFRHKDKSTNVLSFPAVRLPGLPADQGSTLGDLVICAPVVSREAEEQGKTARAHWAHMLVHGSLHLLGLDHIDAAEAAHMEALEVEILASCGFADPYAENRP